MAFKLLISGLPNTGKTTLCKNLDKETTLVISRDGKRYPFAIPNRTIEDFHDAADLIAQITDAVTKYVEKFDRNPETIVIDSISKIILDIEVRILNRVKSFPYGVINSEIAKLMEFIEHQLAPKVNIIYISHALYDVDTASYNLVNAGGSWGKKGGVISEVDQAVFIEIKNKKRIIHHRSATMLARTTMDKLPDSEPIEDYNLQKHVEVLSNTMNEVDAYTI